MTARAEHWNVDEAIKERIEEALRRRPSEYMNQMGWVLTAFQNALYELMHAPTLKEGVIATMQCGGDIDTNGAICGALLGAGFPGGRSECLVRALTLGREATMPRRYKGALDVDDDGWTLDKNHLIVREREGQVEIRFTLSGLSPDHGRFSVEGTAIRMSEGHYATPGELEFTHAEPPGSPGGRVRIKLRIEETAGHCGVDGTWRENAREYTFSGDLEPD